MSQEAFLLLLILVSFIGGALGYLLMGFITEKISAWKRRRDHVEFLKSKDTPHWIRSLFIGPSNYFQYLDEKDSYAPLRGREPLSSEKEKDLPSESGP